VNVINVQKINLSDKVLPQSLLLSPWHRYG